MDNIETKYVVFRVPVRTAEKFKAVRRLAAKLGITPPIMQDVLLNWLCNQSQGKLTEVLKDGVLKK